MLNYGTDASRDLCMHNNNVHMCSVSVSSFPRPQHHRYYQIYSEALLGTDTHMDVNTHTHRHTDTQTHTHTHTHTHIKEHARRRLCVYAHAAAVTKWWHFCHCKHTHTLHHPLLRRHACRHGPPPHPPPPRDPWVAPWQHHIHPN